MELTVVLLLLSCGIFNTLVSNRETLRRLFIDFAAEMDDVRPFNLLATYVHSLRV